MEGKEKEKRREEKRVLLVRESWKEKKKFEKGKVMEQQKGKKGLWIQIHSTW